MFRIIGYFFEQEGYHELIARHRHPRLNAAIANPISIIIMVMSPFLLYGV